MLLRHFRFQGQDYDVPDSEAAAVPAVLPDATETHHYRDSDGQDYDVPDDEDEAFHAVMQATGNSPSPTLRYRTRNGDVDIAKSDLPASNFSTLADDDFERDAEELRKMRSDPEYQKRHKLALAEADKAGRENDQSGGLGVNYAQAVRANVASFAGALVEDVPRRFFNLMGWLAPVLEYPGNLIMHGFSHSKAMAQGYADQQWWLDQAKGVTDFWKPAEWNTLQEEAPELAGSMGFNRSLANQIYVAAASPLGETAQTAISTANVLGFGADRFHEVYDTARQNGLSDDQARTLASEAGALEAGAECLGEILGLGATRRAAVAATEPIGKAIKRLAIDWAKRLPAEALSEELEEAIQGGGGFIIDQLAAGKTLKDIYARDVASAAFADVGMATAQVALMGGGGILAEHQNRKAAIKDHNDAVNKSAENAVFERVTNRMFPEGTSTETRANVMRSVFSSPDMTTSWAATHLDAAIALVNSSQTPTRAEWEKTGLPPLPKSDRAIVRQRVLSAFPRALDLADEINQRRIYNGLYQQALETVNGDENAAREIADQMFNSFMERAEKKAAENVKLSDLPKSIVLDDGKVFRPDDTVPPGTYSLNGVRHDVFKESPARDVFQTPPPVATESTQSAPKTSGDTLPASAAETPQNAPTRVPDGKGKMVDTSEVRESRVPYGENGPGQIDSSGTSLNQLPAGTKKAASLGLFKEGGVNLDIGGGKSFPDGKGRMVHKGTEFLKGLGVENRIADPFSQPEATNRESLEATRGGKADTATINNVLNTISSDENLDAVVHQAARAIKPDGTAIFSFYEGDKSGVGKQTRAGYQRNLPTKAYVPFIEKHFGDVELKNGIVLARKPIRGDAVNAMVNSQGDSMVFEKPAEYSGGATVTPDEDAAYADAVKRGDKETYMRMLRDVAARRGYSDDSSWRMAHLAPTHEDVEGGGAIRLSDLGTDKSDLLPADVLDNPQYYFDLDADGAMESLSALRSAIAEERFHREAGDGKHASIVMYRGVDKIANKHETHFRNGDWITPSRAYALMSARDNPNGGRVITSRVSLDKVFWTGDSISEFGYDSGKPFTYKDTKNSRKLLVPTYDSDGNLIPLSQRFNSRKPDQVYETHTPWSPKFEPKSVVHTTLDAIQNLPGDLFEKAKSGDASAAADIVERVVKPDRIAALAKRHPGAIIVPVHAEEAMGHNQLPNAFATHIHDQTGLDLELGIKQSVRAGHTGASELHRLVAQPEFDGPVQKGRDYILVDDHLTSGGTLNALRDYIQLNGGNVVEFASLTASRFATIVTPKKATLDALRAKHSDVDKVLADLGLADSADLLPEKQLHTLKNIPQGELRSRLEDALREVREIEQGGKGENSLRAKAVASDAGRTGSPGQVSTRGGRVLPSTLGESSKTSGLSAQDGVGEAAVQQEFDFTSSDVEAHAKRLGVPAEKIPEAVSCVKKAAAFAAKTRELYAQIFANPYGVSGEAAQKALSSPKANKGGGVRSISRIVRDNYTQPEPNFTFMKGVKVENASDVASLLMAVRSPYQEMFKVIYLDKDNRIIDAHITAYGSLDRCPASPRDAFVNIPDKARGVIFSHNHPSGDPTPSSEDHAITQRLTTAAELLGLRFVDHVITNGKECHSLFAGRNLAIAEPKLADWELAPIGDSVKLGHPSLAASLASVVRQDGKSNVLVGLDTKNKLTSITLLPDEFTSGFLPYISKALRSLADSASSACILVSRGARLFPRFGSLIHDLHEALSTQGIRFLDCVDTDADGNFLSAHRGELEDLDMPLSQLFNPGASRTPARSVAARENETSLDAELVGAGIDKNITTLLSRFDDAKGKSSNVIFRDFDNSLRVVGTLPEDLHLPSALDVDNRVVKSAEAYLLDHLLNKPGHERQLSAYDARRLLGLINPANEMRVVPQRGSSSLAFIAPNPESGWDCVVIAPRRGEFYIFKTMFAQERKPYQDKALIRYSVGSGVRNEAVDSLIRGPLASIRDADQTDSIVPPSSGEGNPEVQESRAPYISREQIVQAFRDRFPDVTFGSRKVTQDMGTVYNDITKSARTRDYDLGEMSRLLGEHLYATTGQNIPAPVAASLKALGGGRDAQAGMGKAIEALLASKPLDPAVSSFLNGAWGNANPEARTNLEKMRLDMERFASMSPEERVRAFRDVKRPNALVSAIHWMRNALSKHNWTDKNYFLLQGMRDAGFDVDLFDKNLAPEEKALRIRTNPYILATAFQKTSGWRIANMALNGTTDLFGQRVTGPSLHNALAPVAGKDYDAFLDYAVARVAQTYHNRGLTSGVDPADADAVVSKLETPAFKQALDDVTDWSRKVMHLLVDTGVMTRADYSAIVGANDVYLPFMRRFLKGDLYQRKAYKNGKAVHERVGGMQNIENPIEALLLSSQRQLAKAQQAAIVRACIDTMNLAGPDSVVSKWMEEIPAPTAELGTFDKEITGILNGQPVSASLQDVLADFGLRLSPGASQEELETFAKMARIVTTANVYDGRHQVASVVLDGQRHWYQVKDPLLADLLNGYAESQEDGVLTKVSRNLTNMIRFGATMMNPKFGLIRNPIRDTMTAFLYADYHTHVPGLSAIHGIVKDLTGSRYADLYAQMGLTSDTLSAQTMNQAHDLAGQVTSRNALERAWRRGLLRSAASLLSIPEVGPRLLEFEGAYKYWMQQTGGDADAAGLMAACASADLTVNFRRAGKTGEKTSQFVLFMNASIQSIDKFGRQLGLLSKMPWEKHGSGFRRFGRTLLRAGGLLTVTSLLSYLLLRDDDEWKNLTPYEKYSYFHFREPVTGSMMRLPLPFEPGLVFGSLPIAVCEQVTGRNPKALEECFEIMANQLPFSSGGLHSLLSNWTALGPLVDILANSDYKNAPIVPPQTMAAKEPVDWYTTKTSKAAIAMGKALWPAVKGTKFERAAAPAYIDHILNGYTGGLFKGLMSAIDDIKDPSGINAGGDHSTIPLFGTLFTPPSADRRIGDFYDRMDELRRKKDSKSITPEELGEYRAMQAANGPIRDALKARRDVMGDESKNAGERHAEAIQHLREARDAVQKFLDTADPSTYKAVGAGAAIWNITDPSCDDQKRADNLKVIEGMSEAQLIDSLKVYARKRGMVIRTHDDNYHLTAYGRRYYALKKLMREVNPEPPSQE